MLVSLLMGVKKFIASYEMKASSAIGASESFR